MNRMIPFRIEEMEMLHQIPFSPNGVAVRIRASGILIMFNVIPEMEGGNVFP